MAVVDDEIAYYKSLGLDGSSVADLRSKYYQAALAGGLPAAPEATETVAGVVKQAAFVEVPATFADEEAVQEWAADLVAALVAAGIMAGS